MLRAFCPFSFRLCITEVTKNPESTEKNTNAENMENTEDAEGIFYHKFKYIIQETDDLII